MDDIKAIITGIVSGPELVERNGSSWWEITLAINTYGRYGFVTVTSKSKEDLTGYAVGQIVEV